MADDDRKAALERQRALLKSRKKMSNSMTVSSSNHSPRRRVSRSSASEVPSTLPSSVVTGRTTPVKKLDMNLNSESSVDEIALTNEVRSGTKPLYADITPNYNSLPIASKSTENTVEQSKITDKLRDLGMNKVFEPAQPTRFEQQNTYNYPPHIPAQNQHGYMEVQPPPSQQQQQQQQQQQYQPPSSPQQQQLPPQYQQQSQPQVPQYQPQVPTQSQSRRQSESEINNGAMITPQHQSNLSQLNEEPRQSRSNGTQIGNSLEERINFVTKPAPEGQLIHCRIKRMKTDSKRFPMYVLEMESEGTGGAKTFLLCAKKRQGKQTSNYIISHSQGDLDREGDGFIAKLRANFMGTHFTCYDNGINPEKVVKSKHTGKEIRSELTAVIFEKNYLGMKGPRQMTVLMPALDNDQIPYVVRPRIKRDTILERHAMSRTTDLIQLNNKKPQWNEGTQSYVLNFKGRVTEASVKNFQLVHEKDEDYVILQFGRVESDLFTMDFQYPMTAVQAFAISLSSFDGKLACE